MKTTIEIGGDVWVLPFWGDAGGDVRDSSRDNTYLTYNDNEVVSDSAIGAFIADALNYYADKDDRDAEIAALTSVIQSVSGLERCEFNVETPSDCDFCDVPTGAVFASIHYGDTVETNHYVCQNCLPKYIQNHCASVENDRLQAEMASLAAALTAENERLKAEYEQLKLKVAEFIEGECEPLTWPRD